MTIKLTAEAKYNNNLIRASIIILELAVLIFSLSGCYVFDRLKSIGREPELSEIELGSEESEAPQKEVTRYASGSDDEVEPKQTKRNGRANSIWNPNSGKMFKYHAAWKAGDIIKVKVNIRDRATLDNESEQSRSSKDSLSTPNLFGLGDNIAKAFSNDGDKNNMINSNSSHETEGNGNIARNENINMEVAAVVKKVLPNGNLLISGQQEVRVNYEKRQIGISGIVRSKDIGADDSVRSNQIAEARISYGGKGTISDMQQPRYGAQVIDAVAPY